LNTLLATPVYDVILRDSRAAILFVSAPLWDVVAPAVADNPYIRQVVFIGDTPEGMTSFDTFIKDAPVLETMPVSRDEVAFWL
jgi:4-hydroxybenzoate-CoA ligase